MGRLRPLWNDKQRQGAASKARREQVWPGGLLGTDPPAR